MYEGLILKLSQGPEKLFICETSSQCNVYGSGHTKANKEEKERKCWGVMLSDQLGINRRHFGFQYAVLVIHPRLYQTLFSPLFNDLFRIPLCPVHKMCGEIFSAVERKYDSSELDFSEKKIIFVLTLYQIGVMKLHHHYQ